MAEDAPKQDQTDKQKPDKPGKGEGKGEAKGDGKGGKAGKGKPKEGLKTEGEDFRYIVRVANSDLDGHKPVKHGVTSIPGIGIRLGAAVARNLGDMGDKRLGDLTDEEIARLAEAVDAVAETVPPWMLNRQHDYDTGLDTHLLGPEVNLQRRDDINRLKKIRCYKGVRHESGHKVRGQKTCSNGRRGMTLGVSRKKS